MNVWANMGIGNAGKLEKFCNPEGKQLGSTMSETKAAVAERTIQFLKNIFLSLRGRLWIQVQSQIVAICHNVEFQIKNSTDLSLKNVKNPDFLSLLHSRLLREYKKPKFRTRSIVCFSK